MSTTFRIAVAAHLACLYILTFEVKNTLFGFWHNVVAAILTTLMGLIVVLFTVDMATREDRSRKLSKLIDGIIGAVWLAVMVPLVLNSYRAGVW